MNYKNKVAVILQQKRYLSLIALFGLVFALSFIALGYANTYSTNYIAQETSSLRGEQTNLQKNVNLLPDPNDIRLNDPAVTRSLIATSQSAAREIEQTTGTMQQHLKRPWLATFTAKYDLDKTREARHTLQTETHDIRSAITAYADTLAALEQFLVYDPAVDTEDLSLGSSDANERMKRLRGGLTKARTEVSVYSGNYGYAEDILALLATAETTQADLEATGNTDDFIAAFTHLQEEAQTILTTHFDTMRPRLQEQTVNISRSLP